MTGRRAVVICASTRAATGVYPDRTGPLIVAALREWGYDVEDATVVPDGEPVSDALATALAAGRGRRHHHRRHRDLPDRRDAGDDAASPRP